MLALAGLLFGLWRLIVVRQKRIEAETEMPSIDDRYANGVNF